MTALRQGWGPHFHSRHASVMFPQLRACLVPVITIISLGMGTPGSCAKSLALLLLVCVDGKRKVRINFLVEIGDVDVKIRLADLRVCSSDVGDELS